MDHSKELELLGKMSIYMTVTSCILVLKEYTTVQGGTLYHHVLGEKTNPKGGREIVLHCFVKTASKPWKKEYGDSIYALVGRRV